MCMAPKGFKQCSVTQISGIKEKKNFYCRNQCERANEYSN